MKPRYDYVLFDADNTLFDFDEAERRALHWLLETLGLPAGEAGRYYAINRALWHQYDLGEVTADALVVERFRRFLLETGAAGEPAELNRAYLQKLGECPALLPGAEALCRTLSRHCTLAIVTNGMSDVQHSRMEASPLMPYFEDRLFISGELGSRKPERRFFDLTFAGLGLCEADKPKTVVVGDNLLSDVKGALDYGLDAVWYAPGGGTPPPEITPTCVAADFGQVADWILGPQPIER